jgi:hypothetical protein
MKLSDVLIGRRVDIHTFLGEKCHVLTSLVQIVVTYGANSSNSLFASACRAIPSLVASECSAAPCES